MQLSPRWYGILRYNRRGVQTRVLWLHVEYQQTKAGDIAFGDTRLVASYMLTNRYISGQLSRRSARPRLVMAEV